MEPRSNRLLIATAAGISKTDPSDCPLGKRICFYYFRIGYHCMSTDFLENFDSRKKRGEERQRKLPPNDISLESDLTLSTRQKGQHVMNVSIVQKSPTTERSFG